MKTEDMAANLVNAWPTPLAYDEAVLVVDALLDTNGGISPDDVYDLTVVETDLGGIDIQLHIDADKMPTYIGTT